MTEQQEHSTSQPEPSPKKPKQKEEISKLSAGTHGLLGGILKRFSLWPTNQVKLPDDKNPSVCIYE
jgi:hypothetical protein